MALLEGLEVSEVKYENLNLGDRADAEYYSKDNLRIETLLNHLPHIRLSEIAKLTASAFYPAATHLYESGDMPFLRCVDTVKFPVISHLQNDSFIKIPAQFAEESKGINFLRKHDICLTKVGTPCYASIIYEHERIAMSRTVMGLSEIQNIDPFYLTIFLRSKYGFQQLTREREQTIQYQLTLDRVGDIRIFTPSTNFQKKIKSLALESFTFDKNAQEIQSTSEQPLLSALGLKDWQPPNPLTYEASSKTAFTSNRLDAEFFNSKYDAALDALKAAGAKSIRPLGALLKSLTNGHTPLKHNLSEGEVPFICSEHVQDFEVNLESSKRILAEHHKTELKRTQLKNNDILLTIKGRVGNAAIVEGLDGAANINQDVALLRLNQELPHWWIISFINSRFGRLMTEKYQTGQINPFLSLGTIRTLPIPVFEDKLMEDVGKQMQTLVLKARTARQQSKARLERAKRAIEIAIEQDEATALTYLKES